MNHRIDNDAYVNIPHWALPMPLEPDHWTATANAMGLKPKYTLIVELVVRGLTNREIAAAMGLGEGTIKDYLKRIAKKTDTRGRHQLMLRVLRDSHQVLSPNYHTSQGQVTAK